MNVRARQFCKGLCSFLAAAVMAGNLVAFAQKDNSSADEKREVAMSYTAKAAYLMEQDTGKVLFSQNETEPLAPASLTKLMDLILIYEALDSGRLTMEQKLTCSPYAKTMGGSEIWLKEGEQMTVEELLKALIVASANDAAVVFAEELGVSEQGFVELMNDKAKELGLVNTNFVNCTGFDEDGHYTCARDVAVMARELMTKYGEQVTRFSTIWMDSLRNGETELVNTNRLVRFYPGTTGLKTGTTDAAGHCLCATVTRNEMSLISVIMCCKTSTDRFEESKQLLDYGFAKFAKYKPEENQMSLTPVPVLRGEKTEVIPRLDNLPQAVVKRDEISGIEMSVELFPDISAPLKEGEEIGKVILTHNGEQIAEEPIRAGEDIAELTFIKSFGFIVRRVVSLA